MRTIFGKTSDKESELSTESTISKLPMPIVNVPQGVMSVIIDELFILFRKFKQNFFFRFFRFLFLFRNLNLYFHFNFYFGFIWFLNLEDKKLFWY